MIKTCVDTAHNAGIEIAVCGEMAGDPLSIALMLGLGIDSLSMIPLSIPRAKKVLRLLDKARATRLAEKLVKMTSAEEIERTLKKDIKNVLHDDIKRFGIEPK